MQGEASGWLWLAMNVIMPIVLLGALVYGTIQWRNRRRSRPVEQLRDQTTKENYRREDANKQG